jgi:type VI secretion system secreted protein VgrG
MSTYTQGNRPISVNTPLGKDVFLLVGFTGEESISKLFNFRLELLAENKKEIAFDKLLGQKIGVTLNYADDKPRYFSGICSRVSQGMRDETFTHYTMEVVPQFWLLDRRAQSRIFQHLSVPDILKKVLAGLDVNFQIQGTFEPRDYCVQYRESDFAFASRLMEEEGIYYFFKHTSDGHQLMIANTPQGHPDLPLESKIIFEEIEGGTREEYRIDRWEKVQALRSGKYTLWDHNFELPHKSLEAEEPVLESVQVGEVAHKLKVGGNDKLELYNYPGEYAQRFDGIDKGGSPQPSELQKIFQDNKRTVEIRMEQETVNAVVIDGASNCRQCCSGYKFTLERHFNADGQYVLTSVNHNARLSASDYRSGGGEFEYQNTFTCIPIALPFRPQRTFEKPTVYGSQTAVVVGPAGEDIFTDQYGRVKVQFHWDRQGKHDADSSCWIRVGQSWAGKNWGGIFIPRTAMEVIVDFIEGDPDQPIITGCVYNADMMPPYKLPDEKTKSTIKSMSTPGGDGFNEIRFEDKKNEEQIFINGERNLDIRIKNDRFETIKRDRHLQVERDKFEQVKRDKHIDVTRHLYKHVTGEHHVKVDDKEAIKIGGSLSVDVTGNVNEKFSANHNQEVAANYHLKAMNVVIEAMTGLTIKVGGSHITINAGGIQIVGTPLVTINSGGAPLSGPGATVVAAKAATIALEADKAKPGELMRYAGGGSSNAGMTDSAISDAPPHNENSEENKEKTSWIEIELVDEAGQPMAGEAYTVIVPDGSEKSGSLDEKGFARVDHIDPGACKVTFPNLDKDAWEEA